MLRYSEALLFLDSLVNYEKLARPRTEFKLDGIRRLLNLSGNPQERLPNVILVAGTKGKGSVCHMLDAALRGCGLTTGLFVSPHVRDVRERIQLDGRPVSPRLFASQVARFTPPVKKQSVSYFELTAAMAFDLFARRQPDYCIIEVGLGGRLDATNLSDPQVSVITRIGYDHIKVLGGTLQKIAGEKAGVMRAGRPVVISSQDPLALRELERRAVAAEARLVRSDSHVQVSSIRPTSGGISFHASSGLGRRKMSLPLLGRHQVENCRTALAVLDLLAAGDERISLTGIRRGLGRVLIPARCQIVCRQPLTIVDSCHNPESGKALADVLSSYVRGKVILIYGSLGGKLVTRTVRPLAPHVKTAILVRPESPRAMPLPELKRVFGRLHVPYVSATEVRSALALARQSPGPIVIAGSFYLAGEALAEFRS